MIETILFYIFAMIMVVSGLAILVSTNIVRMAYWLIGMLLAVAGIYFLLGAYFLGVVQIIVYVGGVAVLVVFGVMLTSRQLASQLLPRAWEVVWLICVTGIFLAGLVRMILKGPWAGNVKQSPQTVAEIGRSLLGNFIGPFELASVLLLVVLLGAAYLARPRVPTLGIKK
ncbi:MAG: NADH-quinone oxidoreductase subunit J [Phycisphaerae bacterium]